MIGLNVVGLILKYHDIKGTNIDIDTIDMEM